MCPRKPTDEEQAALDLVKGLGYRVRKPGNYAKYTFGVHADTLAKFKKYADQLDYTLQDAATEAFDSWICSKEEEYTKVISEKNKTQGR